MASWDVALTFGADTTQLDAAMSNTGKNIEKKLKPPPLPKYVSPAEKAFTAFQGGGLLGLAGFALGIPGMITEAIGMLIDGVKKFMDEARRIRNLSYETGLSTSQLQKMQVVAESTGLSLDAMAHGMAEFNKKMGEAKIRGSEVNAVMSKLGVGLTDINKGQFKFTDAIIALNKSFKAGTDQATLMHYAVQLFGSSAEQLMPIIKGSTANMQILAQHTLSNSTIAINSMNELSDNWSIFWANLKTIMFEGVGIISASFFRVFHDIAAVATRIIALGDVKGAASFFMQTTAGMTDQQRMEEAARITASMNKEDAKSFLNAVQEAIGQGGTKLTPLGLSEAQGASRIQQMGGGDVMSAIAFTPLDRIADATQQTADNTDQGNKILEQISSGAVKAIVPISF